MFRLSSRFYASMPGASHRLYKYARYNSSSAPETKIENITKQNLNIDSINKKLDLLVEQHKKLDLFVEQHKKLDLLVEQHKKLDLLVEQHKNDQKKKNL